MSVFSWVEDAHPVVDRSKSAYRSKDPKAEGGDPYDAPCDNGFCEDGTQRGYSGVRCETCLGEGTVPVSFMSAEEKDGRWFCLGRVRA